MSFLLRCPNCGERSVADFRFGGETNVRPSPDASHAQWVDYYYFRKNVSGPRQEWWYHKFGCRRWFLAVRDSRTNEVPQTYWPNERTGQAAGDGASQG